MKKLVLLILGLGIFLLYACGKNGGENSQKIQDAIENIKSKIEQSVDKTKGTSGTQADKDSISAPHSAD
jgi:hypothetical protein